MQKIILYVILGFTIFCATTKYEKVKQPSTLRKNSTIKKNYYLPSENKEHEGTWIIWPHHYTYGKDYRNKIEPIWISMVMSLYQGEKVHIIVYNKKELDRIKEILLVNKVNMEQVDFFIHKTNDVWARDTGPIFVFNESGQPFIADFAFNGWGEKTAYKDDNKIPKEMGKQINTPVLKILEFVLEGGSIEVDESGSALLCKSSIINNNRNPNMTIKKAEEYMQDYLGVHNFIWLEGVKGEDITDGHIDGIARFYDDETIITIEKSSFKDLYEKNIMNDYNTLIQARNSANKKYRIVHLPLTSKNVKGVGFKGNYLNYYVGNKVVLLPVYNDKNDSKAMNIMQNLYKDKRVIPIDVTQLFKYGGMIHCITQQQPHILNVLTKN